MKKYNLLLLLMAFYQLAFTQYRPYKQEVLPNPFEKEAIINLELNRGDSLSFSIYNMNGKTVFQKEKFLVIKSGNYNAVFDTLKSGVYISRIEVNDSTFLMKLVKSGTNEKAAVNYSYSIEDLVSTNLLIYPNPASSEFILESIHSEDKVNITIHNSNGQLIKNRLAYPRNSYLKENFNVSTWANGVYLLKAGDKSVQIVVE